MAMGQQLASLFGHRVTLHDQAHAEFDVQPFSSAKWLILARSSSAEGRERGKFKEHSGEPEFGSQPEYARRDRARCCECCKSQCRVS